MAKKYSKYNVYQGCSNMCTLNEALQELKTGKVNADNLYQMQARLELYQMIFNGFSNTEESKTEYEKRKKNILASFTDEEMKEFENNVKATIADKYDKAIAEYLYRISNINMNSADGKADDVPAYDIKTLTTDNLEYYKTRFSKLTNLSVKKEYRCNDDGVYIYDVKSYDYVRVCDPLTIKALAFDKSASTQYIILEYYDYNNNGAVSTICVPSEELSQGKFAVLHGMGIVVDNNKLLTKYLNDLRSVDNKTKKITRCIAATHYGYQTDEYGELKYDLFAGIGDEKIIPMKECLGYDKAIFCKKGTLKGFIDFLEEVSKGKYEFVFKMVVAASVSGIVQAYVNGSSNIIAPATYIFTEESSCGKGLLSAIANNIWAAPNRKNLIVSSDSSISFFDTFNSFLGYLPLVVADFQDLIDRYGLSAVVSMIFQHSNGISGGKCTSSGEIRDNLRVWFNIMIGFNEKDCFTGNSRITGGADARITILPLRLENGDQYITKKNPKYYIAKENQNYGHLGEAFVLKMREKKPEEICNRFFEITQELVDLGIQEKQSNSLALLIQSSELLKEFNLLPDCWSVIDSISLIDWCGAKKVNNPTNLVYELLSEIVFRDPSYVSMTDRFLLEAEREGRLNEFFDSKSKTPMEVRGRIQWQKKDEEGNWVDGTEKEHERAVLLIPSQNLNQLLSHIVKENDIVGFGFDKERWAMNGWLLKGKDGYTVRNSAGTHITRPYSANNRENHYRIVLKEVQSTDEESAENYMNECLALEKTSGIPEYLWGSRCKKCTDEACKKNKKGV